MERWIQVAKASALALGFLGTATAGSGEAARFADGRVLFDRPPMLVEATTVDQQASLSGRYHFVIAVPEDAGEPLEAIAIAPRDAAQRINFRFEASSAHRGAAYASAPELALASVGGLGESPSTILVVFEEPVQPGETITVTLQTPRNPWGGVYLFGVTGYPAGAEGVGQYLGLGRIQIYDNSK